MGDLLKDLYFILINLTITLQIIINRSLAPVSY